MLIKADGEIVDGRVVRKIQKTIERGPMTIISGIIVHQTGGSSANSSLQSYTNSSANGAHFLIDKDGTIYQTASVYKKTWHVGKLKARCVLEKKCRPTDIKALQSFSPSKENAQEMQKKIPDRFPSNQDSIGIELVGETLPNGEYVTVTAAQNGSLHWLIQNLSMTLRILPTEIFRHPTVSRKNPTEASTAKW